MPLFRAPLPINVRIFQHPSPIVIHKLRKYPEPVVSSVSCVIAHRTIVIHANK